MAKGKLHGTAYKGGNQDIENPNILVSGKTLLKRKIESMEHDKNGPYSPSTPKRQTRSSKETNTDFFVSDEVCKSEICTNSSNKHSSLRKGEFKRCLFGDGGEDNRKLRHLRSMGKLTDFLELPKAGKTNVVARKDSHANNSASQKYDKQCLADSPPNTCISSKRMSLDQSEVDFSMADLSDSDRMVAAIADTKATLHTPSSVVKCNSNLYSANFSDSSVPSLAFTPITEQNRLPSSKSFPGDDNHDGLTPNLLVQPSVFADKASLLPSEPQTKSSSKSDITVLEAGSVASRKSKYRVEDHCRGMDRCSPNSSGDQSEVSPEKPKFQEFTQNGQEREPTELADHGDLMDCEESHCKQDCPSDSFRPSGFLSSTGEVKTFSSEIFTVSENFHAENGDNKTSGDNTEESVLGSMGHCGKVEDKPQCNLNKISGSDSSEALCLHDDGCMDRPNFCKISKDAEYMSKCNPEGPHVDQAKLKVPSALSIDNNSSPSVKQGHLQNIKLDASPSKEATPLESLQRDVSVSKNQPLWNSTKIKLKIKMPEKRVLDQVPSTVKLLLSTGLLEGCFVRYIGRAEKVKLTGVIKGQGILCSCCICKGRRVVSICKFEEHAGSTARHASDFIILENGRSLRDVLEAGKRVGPDRFSDVIHKAIEFSSHRGCLACRKCREPIPLSNPRKSNWLCQACDLAEQNQPKLEENQPKLQKKVNLDARPSKMLDRKVQVKPSGQDRMLTKRSPNLLDRRAQGRPSMQSRMQQRDMTLHKVIFKPHGLPDGTKLAYYVKGQRLLEGYKLGSGICCSCCNTEVSCSQFEAHAGRSSRRNPYNSIYLPDGQSLHEVALSLANQRSYKAKSCDENEDICTECGDGGDLLLCDGCPRAFHTDCAGESRIPVGNWFCFNCQHHSRTRRKLSARKEPRLYGKAASFGSQEKPSNRCTRVVNAPEKTVGGCVLCRLHDFDKRAFGDRTVMLCDQCEKEFHVGCLRERGMADLKELPEGEWFCSNDCTKIHSALQKLVSHGPESLPSFITDELMKKRRDKGLEEVSSANISWQLLHAKTRDADSRVLLSEAAAIFAECFDPITDTVTGRDLIPSMVYSKSMKAQEFRGMYCAVLTADSVVVSAAVFRIFGRQVAELPLVATSPRSQGQGYFQSLFSCIERLLGFLNVENLVLPAAEEAESIWISKFGFTEMSEDKFDEYRKDLQIMSFQGNSKLEKPCSRFSSVCGAPDKGL